MAETYCGKSCAECAGKEQLNCPGCKIGPGRQFGGECELAKCVREKGHETCDTCVFAANCRMMRRKEYFPDARIRKLEAEKMRKEAQAKSAAFLGKWIGLLFWSVVLVTIGGLMSNDTTAEIFPALLVPGEIIHTISSLIYGCILLKLRSEDDQYYVACICALISGVVGAVAGAITGVADGATWVVLLTIPVTVVSLVGECNEYKGHSAVLAGVDRELSEKWLTLWKWNIRFFLGLLGCILLVLISPVLGLVAALGIAVGILVIGILKLGYLYRMAQLFRGYSG